MKRLVVLLAALAATAALASGILLVAGPTVAKWRLTGHGRVPDNTDTSWVKVHSHHVAVREEDQA